MSVLARAFCRWLAKFTGSFKKNPARYDYCENDSPSLLTGEVSQAAQDSFCGNYSHDFLQLPQLISTPNCIDHVTNIKKLLLRREALLRGSILENSLHQSGEIKDPMKLILIWYTRASYGLTPFISDLTDYVKCNIQVKYVTNINRIIGIGITLQKCIN